MKNLYKTCIIIVKNIEISSYSVSDLATDLGVSERNLYRRVNDLMNMSVAEYIREVKLQRAHDLLTLQIKLKLFQKQQ